MKAPDFDYAKPRTLDDVYALLAEYGDEARLLAGGQTLMATLNMRLSEPALLIDITGLAALQGIAVQDGMLRIGALATHTQIESSALVAQHAPLLAMAAPHIAHRAIRNLGTLGGSIAYADPAAEWPTCALALDATVICCGAGGNRRIPAAEFFLDLYTTALLPGELVLACDFPLAARGARFHFDELARRHGDYAIAGLALASQFDQGVMRQARIALLGIASTPVRARRTEALLEGRALDAGAIGEAASLLAEELDGALAPMADLTNSSATKRHLATVLLRRALATFMAG
ncbi:MAG: xanthine dehydrogenase family protein subunit M [Oxalobacteraceae bacterium]|nr:MAG: xanthine dehydrogenase family protein subunit M [Oxalobacteraceae bacterium]